MVAVDAKDFCGADIFDFVVDVVDLSWGALCILEGEFIDLWFGFGKADLVGVDAIVEIGEDGIVVRDVVDMGLKGVRKDDEAVPYRFKFVHEALHLYFWRKNR